MKLRDLPTASAPASLRQLAKDDIRILWPSGYFDGPLSGMCSYQDTEYWFVTFQENQGDDTQGQWFRRYAVLALTVEQLAKEHQVHQDFQTYVGDAATSRRPQDQWHVFYDKHLEFVRSARFDENEVVAWFEL